MSKVILYNAISTDGFIAGEHDETPWSDEEWVAFQEFVRSCDVVLLGRRTYSIMRDGGEFVEDGHYIVVTNDQHADTGNYEKIRIQSAVDLPNVEKIGLIGGGELNGSIAALGMIDEVILDVEPITLGQGIHLFGRHDIHLNLRLIATKQIGPSTVQDHYEVMK